MIYCSWAGRMPCPEKYKFYHRSLIDRKNSHARGISVRKQHEQKLLRILISFHERYPAAGLDALVSMIKPICPCVYGIMKLTQMVPKIDAAKSELSLL